MWTLPASNLLQKSMNIPDSTIIRHHMSIYPAENVKKKLWNIFLVFLVYWRESGLKLESQIITRCFSPTEEIMLALHWKENHYPHLHKKKMRQNLKYTVLPELREFVSDLSGFSDQYNLITWRRITGEQDQRYNFCKMSGNEQKVTSFHSQSFQCLTVGFFLVTYNHFFKMF